jgi:hypothetical protein
MSQLLAVSNWPFVNKTALMRRAIMNLGKLPLWALVAVFLLGVQPSFGQEKPYKEGSVWSVTLIKVKPGMLDTYLRDLGSARKKLMDEAKKQGLFVSDKIFIGSSSNRDDWDLMIMEEYKNWAAFDGLSDKFDALSKKLIGPEEKQVEMMVKRTETREILGEKVLQEITLK